MYEINYTDTSFNKESAAEYSLSVQVNQGGLAYSVCHNLSNRIVLFRKHRFNDVVLMNDLKKNILEILEADSTLRLEYSGVGFLGYSRETTLVPEAYYDKESEKSYLSFNDAEETDGTVFRNFIPSQAIYNIFSLPTDLVSDIRRFFGKAAFLNQATTFLKHITRDGNALFKSCVYVGLNPGFFDIACTGQGKLLLYNTFLYANETDLLYYILYIFKCMQFSPEKVPLVISGELSSKLSYLDPLKQCFSEVRCSDETGIPELASGIKQLNAYRFLNLLNVHTCVSSADYTKVGK